MTIAPPAPLFAFLGTPEIIGLVILLVLLFGAKKLPQLARSIGDSLGEFKKAQKEYREDLDDADEESSPENKSS